ncbi:hypothetical protein SAMD00023353_3100100 [Rosellinia necatrix]|uniref:WSC domain-containing protein n=1 Tax=Rosellinia necatrix TaxID=77044 RepID=A0A1W2TWH5_ROSNE|nr:hypothetical protein SAMD00023353_3100100 [Rosellinia necatrix]
MLWSGLAVGSLCDEPTPGAANPAPGETKPELPVLGTQTLPSITTTATATATATATITITTTIADEPSPTPENLQYTYVGCYGQPSGGGGGVFGNIEQDSMSDEPTTGNFTIEDCFQHCSSSAALGSSKGADKYTYAGLQSGNTCTCGLQLSPDARELPDADCATPCPAAADASLSCGGPDGGGGGAVAVYELRPASSRADKETAAPSPGVSTPTVAAIAGSLSGAAALLLAAVLFLCCCRRRRQQHKTRVRARLRLGRRRDRAASARPPAAESIFWRRPPPPIQTGLSTTITSAGRRHDDIAVPGRGRWRRHDKDSGSEAGDDRAVDDDDDDGGDRLPRFDPLPATPALETGGGRPAPGLHARAAAAAVPAFSWVVAGAGEPRSAGASSGVQWRATDNDNGGGSVPATPYTVREYRGSLSSSSSSSGSNSIATPTPQPRPKPPAAEEIGVAIGGEEPVVATTAAAAAAAVAIAAGAAASSARRGVNNNNNNNNAARRGPAFRFKVRARSQPRSPPGGSPGNATVSPTAATRLRRSSDTIAFEAGAGDGAPLVSSTPAPTMPGVEATVARSGSGSGGGGSGGDGGGGEGGGTAAALGMSHHSNASTPSLGRYGSLTRAGGWLRVESPVLGWRASERRVRWDPPPSQHEHEHDGDGERGRQRRRARTEADTRRPGIPVLPPIAPGERFDHRRWRGTIYAQPYDGEDGDGGAGAGARQRRGAGEMSPVSPSSVGTTSNPQELDRRL